MSQIDPSGSTVYAAQLGQQALYGQTFTPSLSAVIAQNPQDNALQYATPNGVYTVYQTNQYNDANHVIIAPPLTAWPTPNYFVSIMATPLPTVPVVICDPPPPITTIVTPEPAYMSVLVLLAMIAMWSLDKARWIR